MGAPLEAEVKQDPTTSSELENGNSHGASPQESSSEQSDRQTEGFRSKEEVESEVEQALACPCVADLRDGPCGPAFIASFSCFIRSQEPEKGMDCLEPFEALRDCMMEHPEEFADFVKPKESDDGTAAQSPTLPFLSTGDNAQNGNSNSNPVSQEKTVATSDASQNGDQSRTDAGKSIQKSGG